MSADQIILVLSMLIVLLSLPMPTKQARKEDCVKGKQYWSPSVDSFIPGRDGVCIACPPNWLTCYDQPIGNKQRCVESCRTMPKPMPSSSSKLPLTPSFIPSEILHTKVLSTLSTSTAYTVPPHPIEVKKSEKEDQRKNKEPDNDLSVIIAASVLSVSVVIAVVALLFVLRKKRRRSATIQRSNEEVIDLENNAGDRLLQVNDEKQCLQEQNNGEGHLQERCHGKEGSDSENRLAVQETKTSVHVTPSERNISAIQDTEDVNFSSSLQLHQVET